MVYGGFLICDFQNHRVDIVGESCYRKEKSKRSENVAEVNVRKRNNGKWEYRFELASVNGKRQQKSKSGFSTKAEALKAGREALSNYESCGQVVTPTEISVSDMFDMWLAEASKTDLQQTTIDGYVKKIRLYVKPNIGHYKVRAITRQILQGLVTDLADQGLSKNTVSSVRGIITKAFDWAEMGNMVAHNPAYRLKLPKNTAVKQRTDKHIYITQERLAKIWERFPEGTTSYLPMQIAYHCGLRLGEVYALCWEDLDVKNKTLSVNRQVQWYQDKSRSSEEKKTANGSKSKGGGYWYFTTPKYGSYRTIEIDDQLLEILKREKSKQDKAQPYYGDRYVRYYSEEALNFSILKNTHEEDPLINPILTDQTPSEIHFICRRESGEYITPRTMQHTSSVIHKQLDFPDFDFHSFRHTHATMLYEKGAPMVYIKNRLGHVKIETTEEVYTNHLTPALKEQGRSTLKEIF